MRPVRRLAAVAALLAGASSSAPAQAPARMDSATALATLDTVWATIGRAHWDTASVGASWRAARDELRPRAAAARTPAELRAVIGEMLGRLGQSHFYLIPGDARADEAPAAADAAPPAAGPGTLGVDVRLVEDRFVLTRVERDGPAWAAGLRPGWTLEAVDGATTAGALAALRVLRSPGERRAEELQAVLRVTARLSGPAGSAAALRLGDGRGRVVERTVKRAPLTGLRTRYGNFPEMTVRLERERLTAPGGARVGVIRFSTWFPVLARGLDAAVDSLRGSDGLVIDLRGNLGGVGGMVMGLAGHLMERPDTLGTLRMRTSSLVYRANPRRVDTSARPVRPYAGPVAILTDGLSASTSEFFAGALQKLGRARVFGQASAGQALPAHSRDLPSGDVLVYAIADYVGPGGYRFEGTGVVPDEAAPPTPAALLAGRDPAMAAALRWIGAQRGSAATN